MENKNPESLRDEAYAWHTLRLREDSVLLAEGFEPIEDGLWRKEGVWDGRKAALQKAWRNLYEKRVHSWLQQSIEWGIKS
jgi:hypothetical protein